MVFESIGQRINVLRTSVGLSQSELARQLGVTPQAVQKWEAMKAEPSRKKIKLLAEFLGCTVAFLEFGKEEDLGNFKPILAPDCQVDLSNGESRVIEWYRKLPVEAKQAVLTLIELKPSNC